MRRSTGVPVTKSKHCIHCSCPNAGVLREDGARGGLELPHLPPQRWNLPQWGAGLRTRLLHPGAAFRRKRLAGSPWPSGQHRAQVVGRGHGVPQSERPLCDSCGRGAAGQVQHAGAGRDRQQWERQQPWGQGSAGGQATQQQVLRVNGKKQVHHSFPVGQVRTRGWGGRGEG